MTIIHDSIYGQFFLEEVLVDIINTKAIQRLKNIHQGGASFLVNPKWNVTRFEHSIGVMLLIKSLGGSIEEQIAGLLHDISHTAFSHVVDIVVDSKNEDYHESIFDEVFFSSEVPSVLLKHNIKLESILPLEKWSLLEQPLPNLCADRIDYTLRDLTHYNKINLDEATLFLNSLRIVNGKLCVNSIASAEWFVKAYNLEVIDFFLDPLNAYGYIVLKDILKIALDKKLLQIEDFKLDDLTIWNKLNKLQDKEITNKIKELKKKVISNENNFDYRKKGKLRIIDPLIIQNNKLVHSSKVSTRVKHLNDIARKKSLKGTFIKVL